MRSNRVGTISKKTIPAQQKLYQNKSWKGCHGKKIKQVLYTSQIVCLT